MHIYVDADACPKVIREILFKAAERTATPLTMIANHLVPAPPSKWVTSLQVSGGFDVADNEIVRRCEAGDLVITSDIPLAAEVIEKAALVLTSRGERYTQNNIGAKLNMRDFMETLRSSGVQSGGQAPMSHSDRMQFANQLDRLLA
ncbi:hypothetical protein SIN8267_01610 [Sinobacterium norvegicum]|uniref:UPF0178 protein SIN8267_01610 n=1 Tax=Sinobacterium norvegicum TaxID=1641715 RepID=A0ABN8EHN2_9GAMM|nr:YaiI/YqxD family protein [Sinobacterium norvegicum]CAH0991504.1 hypothetical protein SIN8267_01610 [Sinobacterium norvegicum]